MGINLLKCQSHVPIILIQNYGKDEHNVNNSFDFQTLSDDTKVGTDYIYDTEMTNVLSFSTTYVEKKERREKFPDQSKF